MKKAAKTAYPKKTSINLVMKEEESADPKVQVGVFAIFFVLLLLFTKFAVIDKLSEANRAREAFVSLQTEVMEMKENNQDYDQVREEYSHYSNGYLNEDEENMQDRMDILTLIEKDVMSKASIQSLEITDNNVKITLNETTLNVVSAIVKTLEADERTSYVTVSTAKKNSEESTLVNAEIVIELVDGGDKQ